ncbi:UvrD-helicase domain-containing protein [Kineosporia sp. NBRC 101731]|uniref:HelD family protein n=1 Tax=Kineosporia sp. NBRC 101731 TaxID=3032199 RepID=UPI0024A26CDD|nr:UvrD-helicase domain-containing protein [Kineosporia sp. NBRC 101731]GLY32609.1 DNA helicase [Kineosporia sp. NBRC 101731]
MYRDLSGPERLAVAQEQEFLDRALARHDQVLSHLESEIKGAESDHAGKARARGLRQRYEELRRARDGLVFGRLDAQDGTVRRIGRIGLREEDEDADPLVVDWRAEAARAFYTATPLEPQGQSRRRHLRVEATTVVGVNDEPLDAQAAEPNGEIVGEGALLAALGQRRTGQMSTAIATLQREQDDIVRAPANSPLIVQGGPGTGKTVVALHRVAYLLFTHRQMADQAVLVLGPSTRFLDYIAQVLPALGETAVVSCTLDALIPGITVTRAESRRAAEVKGRAGWQPAIESHVASLRPPPQDLTVRWEGESYTVPGSVVRQALRSVSGRPYHQARRVFTEHFRQILTEAVLERREAMLTEVEEGLEDVLAVFDRGAKKTIAPAGTAVGADIDGMMSDDEVDDLRANIAASADIATFLRGWWPDLDPQAVLEQLLHDEARLRRHAGPAHLNEDEIDLVTGERAGWAPSDVPLLDAVADQLGSAVEREDRTEEFVADRARSDRGWVYGHVVIDEAQELSEMQWHMVLRRCPTGSVTAVGDIDQTEAAHRHTSWDEAVRATLGERWTPAELTICYRTPREVMELTGPVLAGAGSGNTPPRAVRSSGVRPWESMVDESGLPAAVVQAVAAMSGRWAGGTVGVVAPERWVVPVVKALRAGAADDVPVLTATGAKGLEWDATLVVDPHGITREPRGWNGLYVALTRCTQELGQLRLSGQESLSFLPDA